MKVSFVLATYNRREVLAHTVERLADCGLDRGDYEIIVVDNNSDDGTPDAIEPRVDRLVRLRRNRGSCAKAFGVDHAEGRYIVFLDDDSFPRLGSVPRMVEHFEADPTLGAAGYRVHLPDGREEGAALPDVFVGCGAGFRAEALRAAGGLDASFFMQAEEYDLSFRLAGNGWGVKVFDDLHVEHAKTTQARRSDRTIFHDVHNNLRVAARYLPGMFHGAYRNDWLARYRWLAGGDGRMRAYRRGVAAGWARASVERWSYRAHRLQPDTFERFFCWERIEQHMHDLAESGVRRIVLADLGKNCLPFRRGAARAGIKIVGIGDDRFRAPGRRYRGTPILALDEAMALDPDAIVVANTGAVHASVTCRRLADRTSLPVHSWFSAVRASSDHATAIQSALPRYDSPSSRLSAAGV